MPRPRRDHHTPHRLPPLNPTVLVAMLLTVGIGGCGRALLAPTETRSPFDPYDTVRGQYAAQKVPDEFGREKLNLRERLAPK